MEARSRELASILFFDLISRSEDIVNLYIGDKTLCQVYQSWYKNAVSPVVKDKSPIFS